MNHSAQNAQQHKTHGAAPKPRASVPRLPAGQPGNRLSQRAEGLALQLASSLSDDLAIGDAHAAHGHYMRGFLGALEATGIVSVQRITTLYLACNALLDGNLTLQDLKAMKATDNAIDATYLRAVSLVNRARCADAAVLASQLDTSEVSARRLIERMHADGIVTEPDLFGIHTLRAVPEVRHD